MTAEALMANWPASRNPAYPRYFTFTGRRNASIYRIVGRDVGFLGYSDYSALSWGLAR
jgi:hypothetical protein